MDAVLSPQLDAEEIVTAFKKAAETGEPVDSQWQNLRGVNLLGKDLSGLDFSGCDFTGAELSRCNFQNAICSQAIFDKATLFQAKLDGVECLGASFQNANLSECSAKRSGFGRCNVSHAKFVMADLTGATFVNATAHHADFRTSKMAGARFLEADLSHADFSQADLTEVDLRESNLGGATFSKSNLRAVRLPGVRNYTTAHWIGADIRDIYFAGAYLVRRHIADENFLDEFRRQSQVHKWIYWFWSLTSDCGRSMSRWGLFCAVIVIVYGFIFQALGKQIAYPDDLARPFAPWYFSIVNVTTLGFGDVLPKSTLAQILVNSETILGYLGLGGLLTIMGNMMGRRGE
ncbi:MAG: pentapeptide repeat-containing protein [Verrucomicrobia bacterium]|nr:pentapeptide repeat-containing protein [Verrucomicrobiota bacterium]